MRSPAILALSLLLASCSLVSPYRITFTTQEDAVVDPATDTLDFVVSAPALAYISEVECDGADDIELLPVVTDEMQAKTAHNLALTMLNGAPGAECDITVTAFDQTTTATAQAEISVVIFGEVVEGEVVEEEATDEETPVEEEVVSEEMPAPGSDVDETVVEAEVEVEAETAPTEETPAE